MRLVATSDTHFPVDITKIPDGDVFVHAGDLLTTGYLDEWRANLAWLAALPHKLKLFVPGNHDYHMQIYPGSALQEMRKAGVLVVGFPGNWHFKDCVLPNGMKLLGLPYVVGLDRWAFNATEKHIESHLKQLDEKYDIVVSHSPIYGHLDQEAAHVTTRPFSGIEAYVKYRDRIQPTYWIHGHIHEQYGYKMVGNTHVYNVAMCNRSQQHAHAPVVLDL